MIENKNTYDDDGLPTEPSYVLLLICNELLFPMVTTKKNITYPFHSRVPAFHTLLANWSNVDPVPVMHNLLDFGLI